LLAVWVLGLTTAFLYMDPVPGVTKLEAKCEKFTVICFRVYEHDLKL